MRYIDLNGVTNPTFEAEAATKRAELLALDPLNQDAYKDYLDEAKNGIWNILKPQFETLSKKKCWYTEAYASVSDFEVDHFRPKKRVSLIKPLDKYKEARTRACLKGYWWLSYEIDNYRLSGHKPNNRKRNYFPLRTGSPIAVASNASWKNEITMLLDPCVQSDPLLLSFAGTMPEPADPNPITDNHIKARISIKVYGLDSEKLKGPKSEIHEIVSKLLSQADDNWALMKIHKINNVEAYSIALKNFSDCCSNLVAYLKPEKQFTRMVQCHFESLTNEWIQLYVLDQASRLGYFN